MAEMINTTLGSMSGATSPRMRLELLAARLLAGREQGFVPAASAAPQSSGSAEAAGQTASQPAPHVGFVGAARNRKPQPASVPSASTASPQEGAATAAAASRRGRVVRCRGRAPGTGRHFAAGRATRCGTTAATRRAHAGAEVGSRAGGAARGDSRVRGSRQGADRLLRRGRLRQGAAVDDLRQRAEPARVLAGCGHRCGARRQEGRQCGVG